jgi:FlaA1/EpsC-like NDP-sugar epimerase
VNVALRATYRLSQLSPRAKTWVMLGGDAVFMPLCMLAAIALRTGSLQESLFAGSWHPLYLAWATIPALAAAGLYKTVVRYLDLRVLLAAGMSLAAAVVLLYGLALMLPYLQFPRASLLIYWFVAFAYVITSRFVARALLQRGVRVGGQAPVRTAIYGAGEAGAQLAHSMAFSTGYRAVCFFDDRAERQRKTVAGLHVHPVSELGEAVYRYGVDQIVVAIPSAGTEQKRALIRRVEGAGLPVKILPSLNELVDGEADLSAIREVDVADLLGRDPVPPDEALLARHITGKVVLVTGAGGSIGSELCRQVVGQQPAKLLLLDHSEFGLYAIEHELRRLGQGVELVACLGSVLDEALLRKLMVSHGVHTVYHAAAYKHVPIVEANVQQGLLNNVFGTRAVAQAAAACGVQSMVLISTDKAVRPTNVMGASKRIAELVVQASAAQAGTRTVYSMVRFGNVLGSSGSVVPLFRQQIKAGGPITITHPDITRYFMLIPEAVQLVIQAGAMARGGEVFVLDMGEPVRIADLARSMIRLTGLTERTDENPQGDIAIESIGLRPGEKLYEELLIGDNVVQSGHPRVMCAREGLIEPPLLDKLLSELRAACAADDEPAMLRLVRQLVPEYRPAHEVNQQAMMRREAAGEVQAAVAAIAGGRQPAGSPTRLQPVAQMALPPGQAAMASTTVPPMATGVDARVTMARSALSGPAGPRR